MLSRFGSSYESADRLAAKAAEAELVIGIHGVSVTARQVDGNVSKAARDLVELYFIVHDTPSKRDPFHRTIELPKPVTVEVSRLFNQLFGRIR